jgi:glycerate 2-kinase
MRTILIAPTAFKGTLSPIEVASAIENAVREVMPEPLDVVSVPIADGGDGTIEAAYRILRERELRDEQCLGALGQPVLYSWLKSGTNALVELASCCGIAQLKGSALAPMDAHTFGLGQAIARCHEAGCLEINIAVGGSASSDGGMGALKALGAVFFDELGEEIESLGGGALSSIADVDLEATRWVCKDALGNSVKLRVLTDVDNPLIGEQGAAAIFAPQKGAAAEQVAQLDAGLANFADVLEAATGRQCRDVAGAGAAGGTAFGLACALGAEITSGFEWIAAAAELDERISYADLVITGEGCFDSQSLSGKATGRLIAKADRFGKKILVVSGCRSSDLPELKYSIVIPKAGVDGRCGRREIAQAIRETVPQLFHV